MTTGDDALAIEPDDEIVVEGRAGERLWDVFNECIERERAADATTAKPNDDFP